MHCSVTLASCLLPGLFAVCCAPGRACLRMNHRPSNVEVLLTAEFSVFLYGFSNGGPSGLVYGYLFCWLGTLTTVASLAEMASM